MSTIGLDQPDVSSCTDNICRLQTPTAIRKLSSAAWASRIQNALHNKRLAPGTKKYAGTAIWASKLSPVGLLRVQDGLILLAAASSRNLAPRISLAVCVLQKVGSSDFDAAPVLQEMPQAPMNVHGSELFWNPRSQLFLPKIWHGYDFLAWWRPPGLAGSRLEIIYGPLKAT